MKKITNTTSMALSLLFVLSSCASMTGTSYYKAAISAKGHPDAEIYVNGERAGSGVATGTYKRNEPLVVEIRDQGCENKEVTFEKTIRGGNVALSALFFGVLGVGIDFVTGAAYKPEHKTNESVMKISDRNFNFQLEFDKCE